jgi:adenine-specific DNA-methyltransferase
MEKICFESPDLVQRNIELLSGIFPNCITETLDPERSTQEKPVYKRAVNFDLLRQMLSDDAVEGGGAFELTWAGKRAAIVTANSPLQKTLRPCLEESRDWDTTENLYIEGENLEVLKLLQRSYLGAVKMIYIDPPYNTGNDRLYRDDYRESRDDYDERVGARDEDGIRLFRNTDANGRFHSDWCSIMYARLLLARNLLRDDGAIFISVDNHEQETLKLMCDEIFGMSRYVGKIAVVNNLKGRNDKKDIAICHEYLLIYRRGDFTTGGMPLSEKQRAAYSMVDKAGNPYQLRDLRKRGRPDRREDRPNMYFPIYYNEETKECSLTRQEGWVEIFPLRGDGSDGRWRWGRERVEANLGLLEPYYSQIAHRWGIRTRVYLSAALAPVEAGAAEEDDSEEERLSKSKSFWMGGELSSDVGRRQLKELFGIPCFDHPKSVDYILRMLHMGTDRDSIVLDFFSGSATTAHAVMQLNAQDGGRRKFIMVQIPELCPEGSEARQAGFVNICEIGKERIRRAGDKLHRDLGPGAAGLDTGFRVLKTDSGNMADIHRSTEVYTQLMIPGMESNIKPDRSGLDLLFGCLLDWGLPLSKPFQCEMLEGCEVYTYDGGALLACFASPVPESVMEEIIRRRPRRAVFRDAAFTGSLEKINIFERFKRHAPGTRVKVI